jgi:hypothetical protein
MSRKKRERRAKKDRAEKVSFPFVLAHPGCERMTGELTYEREHVALLAIFLDE